MESEPTGRGEGIEFELPVESEPVERRSIDRTETGPARALLDYLGYEARKSPELLKVGKNLLDMLSPRGRPELLRGLGKVEREAKWEVDRRFAEAGFSIERIELRRDYDGRPYPTTFLYRRGDRYPGRGLLFSHGYTAGYESHAAVLDSPLTDFTIGLINRPGVDPEATPVLLGDYQPAQHYREQMAGLEQGGEVMLERGCRELVLAGHSMSAMLIRSNLDRRHRWSPELRRAVMGSVLLNGPDSRDVLDNTPFKPFKPVVRRMIRTVADAAASVAETGEWPEDLETAPSPLRQAGRYSPESVAKTIASLAVVDRMLGQNLDPLIYNASKHRAKHTDWRTLAIDLDCMSHAPERYSQDNLLGLYHLVVEGQYDRLVLPGTGPKIAKALSTAARTGEKNTSYMKVRGAGHFLHASHAEEVNLEIYEFLRNPQAYTETR